MKRWRNKNAFFLYKLFTDYTAQVLKFAESIKLLIKKI